MDGARGGARLRKRDKWNTQKKEGRKIGRKILMCSVDSHVLLCLNYSTIRKPRGPVLRQQHHDGALGTWENQCHQ